MRDVRHRKAIYRIADQYSAFKKFSQSMSELEKELAKWVDVVVYAAQSLEGHVKSLAPRAMVHLPNGVNFNHFSKERMKPSDFAAIPKPIAVYVGAMDVWFDWDLINYSAERLPEVSFVLIGPDEHGKKLIRPRRNLWLLGSRPYDELPGYLQHADVGLIPFDVINHEPLVRTIHPLKLYEYLASGLPVVAVGWEELQHLESPATLGRTPDEFVAGIRKAIVTPPERKSLQRYASDKDWSRTVQRIIEVTALNEGCFGPKSG
jgi:glycosyltransferase involved in cell wall biosynthesis